MILVLILIYGFKVFNINMAQSYWAPALGVCYSPACLLMLLHNGEIPPTLFHQHANLRPKTGWPWIQGVKMKRVISPMLILGIRSCRDELQCYSAEPSGICFSGQDQPINTVGGVVHRAIGRLVCSYLMAHSRRENNARSSPPSPFRTKLCIVVTQCSRPRMPAFHFVQKLGPRGCRDGSMSVSPSNLRTGVDVRAYFIRH